MLFFLCALCMLCALGSVAPSGVARAQDAVAALVDEGLDLREAGEDEAALSRFQAAYDLRPEPRILAQIALAEMATTRWVAAERHLREATAARTPWVVEHRGVLDAALIRIRNHLGQLRVEAQAQGVPLAGAEVYAGGQRVAQTPMQAPVYLAPGTQEVVVRAAGHNNASQSVTLAAGALSNVRVTLVPGTSEAVGSGAGGTPSIPGILLTAVGAAALIAGGTLVGVAFAEKGALEDPESTPAWTPEAQSRADAVPVMAASGQIALGVGAAALAVGIVFLLVDGGSGADVALDGSRLHVRF